MKANLDGLMVKFNSTDLSLPIIAIQAVTSASSIVSHVYLKPEYRYNNMNFLIIYESYYDIVETINQVIINANKQILEEA